MRLLPILSAALLLNACTTPAPQNTATTEDSVDSWRRSLRQYTTGMEDVASTTGAAIPILGSPALAREWGPPSISKSADGSYRLRYTKKGELYGLICLSLTGPVANPATAPAWAEEFDDPTGRLQRKLHPQEWRQATIAGHTVNWCQVDGGGGADYPTFSTCSFPHTTPSGRSGHYVVQAWSDSPENAAGLLRKAAFLSGN